MALESGIDLSGVRQELTSGASGHITIIDDIELSGVSLVTQSAGMQAPERTTEKGIDYASYVGAENRSVTIEVTLDPNQHDRLANLRNAKEPFKCRMSHVNLPECKLVDLTVDREASIKSHYKATIKLKEVQQVATGVADLVTKVDNTDGNGNGSVKTSGSDKPTTERTSGEEQKTSDDGPDGEEISNNGINAITDWMGL